MNRTAGRLFSLLAVALAGAILAWLWFRAELSEPGPLEVPVTIVVPRDASGASIAEELERRGIVSSALVFTWRARWLGQAHLLQAGEYSFEPGVLVDEVIDRMVEGQTLVHSVTVPEGLTSTEIVALLDAHETLRGEIADVPAEGTLLPETYHFERGETRADVLERMAGAMDSVLAELWAGRAEGLPLDTPEEAVILASIVEKETGLSGERAHIAGVFFNRLDRGMRLQSDPTVIFALTRGRHPLGRDLLRSDWDHADPYNTYLHAGLPPGPIANPGRAALAAVLDPLETRDLYFVADGEGGHAFAETLDEHNRNVTRYRGSE